jgi:WD40 repeat protein
MARCSFREARITRFDFGIGTGVPCTNGYSVRRFSWPLFFLGRVIGVERSRYHLWDPETHLEKLKVPLPDSIRSPRLSLDGTRLAFAIGKHVHILEVETGEGVSYSTNDEELLLALSPDGNLLALRGDPASTVRLFEIEQTPAGKPALKRLGELRGHQGEVTALAFSPDSKTLASGSRDKTILIWDVTDPPWSGYPAVAERDEAERHSKKPPVLHLPFDGEVKGVGVIPTRMALDEGVVRFGQGKKGKALRLRGGWSFPRPRT